MRPDRPLVEARRLDRRPRAQAQPGPQTSLQMPGRAPRARRSPARFERQIPAPDPGHGAQITAFELEACPHGPEVIAGLALDPMDPRPGCRGGGGTLRNGGEFERPADVADADRTPVVVDIPPTALISTSELRIGLRAWKGGDSLPSPVSLGMVPEF